MPSYHIKIQRGHLNITDGKFRNLGTSSMINRKQSYIQAGCNQKIPSLLLNYFLYSLPMLPHHPKCEKLLNSNIKLQIFIIFRQIFTCTKHNFFQQHKTKLLKLTKNLMPKSFRPQNDLTVLKTFIFIFSHTIVVFL